MDPLPETGRNLNLSLGQADLLGLEARNRGVVVGFGLDM